MPYRSRAQNQIARNIFCDTGFSSLFFSGVLQVLHPPQLIRGILQAKMHVGIQHDSDIAIPHQVLERSRIHARISHIATVGMAADVGNDLRYLYSEIFLDSSCASELKIVKSSSPVEASVLIYSFSNMIPRSFSFFRV